MNSRNKTGFLSLVISSALAGIPLQNALAQSDASDAESASALEEVIVTASRRSESLQDTGLSVTAWQPENFVDAGLGSLRDVVEYSPGVYYRGGATPADNSITIRGVSNFTAAPSVGIYVDDVPIGSGNNNASGATLALDVMQMDLERVEVIKGPQGTLYGASSMGGIIRYITRDASTEEFGGTFNTDWSTTKHGEFSERYQARLNVPLVKDRLGFSISGFTEDVGGFIDRIPEATSGAAKNVNGYDSNGFMATLNANITDRFSATLMALSQESKWHGANIVALDGPPFELAYGPYDTDTSYSDEKNSFDLYGLTLNYQFDGAELISSTSYQEMRTSSVTDLVVDFGPLIELFAQEPVTEAPFTGAIPTDRFVQEVRLTSDANESLEWTVGGIYSKETSGNQQRLEGLPSGFVLLDVNIPSKLEEYAAFGSLTYYLTPDFDLTAGARLSHVETSVAVDDGPEILVADTPPTVSKDTIDTYSFGARYRPAEDMSLYARIASGYRPENANLPLQDVNGNNVAPLVVETDTLWSYEAGVKGTAAQGKVAYDFAAWYLNWQNLQARIYVNGAMTGGNANSDVTAYGLEGSLTFNPIDQLSIITSFAYSHSTLDDDETSAFGAVAGENLPGIPKWSFSALANYTFAVTDTVDGFAGAGVRYIGDRDTGFDGGTGADGSEITPLIANFVLDSYVVADLHAGFTWDRFTGTVYATNLFDEYAYSGGVARPAVGFIRATANVITPRTVGLRLRYDF